MLSRAVLAVAVTAALGLAEGIGGAQKMPGLGQLAPAERGKRDALGMAAHEQRLAEGRLELLDGHGDGGLGDGKNLGGTQRTAVLGRGHEIAELLERNLYHSIL